MWSVVALAVSLSVVGTTVVLRETGQPVSSNLQSDSVAANMLVYDRAATTFAISHPGFAGLVGTADLALPDWYRNLGGWTTRVSPGRYMVTYSSLAHRADPNLVDALMRFSYGQMMVGIAQGDAYYGSSATRTSCVGVATPTTGCQNELPLTALTSLVPAGTVVILRTLR